MPDFDIDLLKDILLNTINKIDIKISFESESKDRINYAYK